jgi:poly(ribitol-phosphate) beta-N-acetylglucosaminyltransferase
VPVKVSVVVPVYNPGRHVRACIASIVDQSMAKDEYEAIFVDDGSTDETPARLDALAVEQPNIRVIHQENSGWPGKPRNVGIDAARGDYVYFVDNDDHIGHEALERLHAMAARNHADVVIGKMAGHGRRVPRYLFFENRDRATLADTPLIDSLTPHKLFRRAFLERHRLRFPEGRRRLEDHPFVVRSYFAAETICVLADYVCYYHVRRDDRSNAGFRAMDPPGYYGNLREVLEIIEANTEPGPLRDRLLLRFVRGELLGRLRGKLFLGEPDDYRALLFDTVRGVILDHAPSTLEPKLAPTYRVLLALVRADRRDLAETLARHEADITAHVEVRRLGLSGGRTLDASFEAWIESPRGGVGVEHHADEALIAVPPAVAAFVSPDIRRLPGKPGGVVLVLVRHRGDSAEFRAPARIEQRVVDQADGTQQIRFDVESTLDASTLAAGRPLSPGAWDVFARVEFLGYGQEAKVAGPIHADATGRLTLGGRDHRNRAGRAAFDIYERLPAAIKRAVRVAYMRLRRAPTSLRQLIR